MAHKICCSAEQEDSLSKLINQVEIIRKSCPSCTMNAKKYFCNLFCLPNQNEIVNIEKKVQNSIVNITYVINEKFAQTFFDSCYDVKIFGAYLMDQDFICGTHMRVKCDVKKFLTTLGSIAQMPFVIRPVITNKKLVTILGQNFTPMSGEVYHCYEAPPQENKCSCDNCHKRCNETLLNNTIKETNFYKKLNKNSANTNVDQSFMHFVFILIFNSYLLFH